jgi:hypothetical protein
VYQSSWQFQLMYETDEIYTRNSEVLVVQQESQKLPSHSHLRESRLLVQRAFYGNSTLPKAQEVRGSGGVNMTKKCRVILFVIHQLFAHHISADERLPY